MNYEALLPYCKTDRQREIINARTKHSSNTKAAKSIGISRRSFDKAVNRVKEYAARQGFAPKHDMTKPAPEGYRVKGVSTLYDEAGNLKAQWVKTQAEKADLAEGLRDFVEHLCEEVKPAKPRNNKTKYSDSDLLSGIFIGDGHIGMKAYGKETRHSNFDTEIAKNQLEDAVDDLVDRAPNAETGMLVSVGDLMHANTSHNQTFNGTPVDVDTRQPKTMRTAAEVIEYAINRMLDKFKKLIVVIVRGNHDPDAAVAVQMIVEAYFRNEPRVTVLPTEGFYHYLEWGKWLFGANHGDKVKPQKLVSIMARDMAAAWGRTTHRMWFVGHFHHQNELELDGCIVRKFGALPPPDGWHASMGFGSSQVMEMITFKKQGGKHSTYLYEIHPPMNEPDIAI